MGYRSNCGVNSCNKRRSWQDPPPHELSKLHEQRKRSCKGRLLLISSCGCTLPLHISCYSWQFSDPQEWLLGDADARLQRKKGGAEVFYKLALFIVNRARFGSNPLCVYIRWLL